jgi:hypothetical protein
MAAPYTKHLFEFIISRYEKPTPYRLAGGSSLIEKAASGGVWAMSAGARIHPCVV